MKLEINGIEIETEKENFKKKINYKKMAYLFFLLIGIGIIFLYIDGIFLINP